MKRIISLLLAIIFIFPASGCKKNTPSDNSTSNDVGNNNNQNQNTEAVNTIVVPEYKDYGRGTVDFDKLVYSRPDLAAAISSFEDCTELVNSNTLPPEEQIKALRAIEEIYVNAETMYSMVEIYSKKDASVSFWQEEYLYLSSGYPAFARAVEDLLIACAVSEHKTAFENDYFGYSLDEYVDGGSYTDELVALLEQEAIKEAEYASLSTATVNITYKSVSGLTLSGTADEVYKQAEEQFGKDTIQYKNATLAIDAIYRQKVKELSVPIYVDLLKIRRLIADELGYESYIDYAYENMGYDYSPKDIEGLLDSIAMYVTPVAERLDSVTFTTYFQKNNQPRLNEIDMINTLYEVYKGAGDEFFDAYSYMLQHKLYDIAPESQNRFNGAFTAYVDANNSPFVFVSTSGFIRDYSTLAHEFGHFYDGVVNYGDSASLDLAEVSSQGLEYLTILRLRSKLKMTDYEYLEYYTMYTTLKSVLLEQSFYATFEHIAYNIDYDNISVKSLNEASREAFVKVYGRELESSTDLMQYLIMPHTILYPFYVESYVVSAIPALEIFFMESYRTGESGKGFEAYKQLVQRENADVSFTDKLAAAGLSSPFEQDTVKRIANLIHYQILGKDYFTSANTSIDAA